MSEADFSGKHLGVSGALILAAFISGKYFQDNGALSKLTIGDGGTPAILELGMTEGNFSNAGLGTGGAIILAAWIEHK